MRRVLGVDLAYTRWQANGSAMLEFTASGWADCRPGIIAWPDLRLTPREMAAAIDRFARDNAISAVSLDGPQGWRDPRAAATPGRRGVGRLCEYESRTPGKTGTFQVAYPGNWVEMANFCTEVFQRLLQTGRATLVNAADLKSLQPSEEATYYVLECFPTSTWRTSGLSPLPGHQKAPPRVVKKFCGHLRERYGLPDSARTDCHDDLQAVVAALPAAALTGGPCQAVARGEPASRSAGDDGTPPHIIEGLIWDAQPAASVEATTGPANAETPSASSSREQDMLTTERDSHSPILPNDRDPRTPDILKRGVALFERLVRSVNEGKPVGVGYSQFVRLLHGAKRFSDVCGRNYLPSDANHVIRLAMRVTQAAGGRKAVSANSTTLQAGMDTFIWNAQRPHDRPVRTWQSRCCVPPYTREEWLRVFPDGIRTLLDE